MCCVSPASNSAVLSISATEDLVARATSCKLMGGVSSCFQYRERDGVITKRARLQLASETTQRPSGVLSDVCREPTLNPRRLGVHSACQHHRLALMGQGRKDRCGGTGIVHLGSANAACVD